MDRPAKQILSQTYSLLFLCMLHKTNIYFPEDVSSTPNIFQRIANIFVPIACQVAKLWCEKKKAANDIK
jgi:hypothetical protein